MNNTPEITEVAVKDLKVGMVRQRNEGRTSTIYKIERESPRSTWYRVSYRADAPRPDGRRNTVTQRTRGYLPIHTSSLEGGPVEIDPPLAHTEIASALKAF